MFETVKAAQAVILFGFSVNLILNTDRIVCLLEPKVSDKKEILVIGKLYFDFSRKVKIVGFSRRIWISWKETFKINIIHNHPGLFLSAFLTVIPLTLFNSFLFMVAQIK